MDRDRGRCPRPEGSSQRIEDRAQVRGQGGFDSHGLAPDRVGELELECVEEKAAEAGTLPQLTVPPEVSVDAVAGHGVAAGGGLYADLVGAAGDEDDLEETAAGTGIVLPDAVGEFGVRGSAAAHGGANGFLARGLDEAIEPAARRGAREALDEGGIRLMDTFLLEEGAAGGGNLLAACGKEDARGVLVEAVDEPDRAGGAVEAAGDGVVVPLEGAGDARPAKVGVGEDAVGFGDGKEGAVVEEDRAAGEERFGHGTECRGSGVEGRVSKRGECAKGPAFGLPLGVELVEMRPDDA